MNFDFEISRIDKLKNWTLKHLGKRNVPNLWNKTKYEFEMESEVPTCIYPAPSPDRKHPLLFDVFYVLCFSLVGWGSYLSFSCSCLYTIHSSDASVKN